MHRRAAIDTTFKFVFNLFLFYHSPAYTVYKLQWLYFVSDDVTCIIFYSIVYVFLCKPPSFTLSLLKSLLSLLLVALFLLTRLNLYHDIFWSYTCALVCRYIINTFLFRFQHHHLLIVILEKKWQHLTPAQGGVLSFMHWTPIVNGMIEEPDMSHQVMWKD